MFSPTRLRASSRLWAPTGEIAPHPINQNYGAHSERLRPTRLSDDIRKADVRTFENAKSRRPKFVVSLICHSKSYPYNSLTESCFRAPPARMACVDIGCFRGAAREKADGFFRPWRRSLRHAASACCFGLQCFPVLQAIFLSPR